MNLKMFFVLFALFGLVFSASAALGVSSYSVSPTSIKPGSSGKAVVTITNNGDETASQVSLAYTPSIGGYSGSYTDKIFVGDIAGKGSTIVTIPFSVSSTLSPKVYSFTFDIYSTTSTSGTKTSGGSIPISVTNPPILSFITLNVSKQVISPSSIFQIHAKIKNDGGEADNLQLIYPVGGVFTSSASNNVFIGNINAGETKDVELPFQASSSITEGVYSILLNYSFDDSNGISSTGQASFGPIIAAQLSQELSARIESKNLVQPGGTADLEVVLTNLQDQTLSNLIISLASNTTNYVVLDGNDKKVDVLPGGSEIRVPFKVGISPSSFSSFYPIDVKINYVSPLRGGSSVTKTGGIQVSGASSFNVAGSTTPSPLTLNDQIYNLALKISNTGNSPVRALSVTVDADFLNFINGNGDYIGTLNLDDFSTLSLNAVVKPGTTNGQKNMTVHLIYKDTYNREYSDIETVSIQVFSVSEANAISGQSSGILWLIILVIISAGVWFGVRKYKSKNKA